MRIFTTQKRLELLKEITEKVGFTKVVRKTDVHRYAYTYISKFFHMFIILSVYGKCFKGIM